MDTNEEYQRMHLPIVAKHFDVVWIGTGPPHHIVFQTVGGDDEFRAKFIARAMNEYHEDKASIVRLQAALADLLTGIDVHNQRMAGRTDIPVPRIEGPVVEQAHTALRKGS